jgi:Casein kinase substrate phosphoprotein PP28
MAHERYMRLQEQGKTEQARKDLGTQKHHNIFLFFSVH